MRLLEGLGRRRDAGGGPVRQLVRSGMVDVEYYVAQTGRQFADATAVAGHYLESGASAGHSLHPLFEPDHLRSQRPDEPGEPALRYLSEPAYAKLRPHPLFDLRAATRIVGKSAAAQPGGAWLAWVRQASSRDPVPVPKDNPPLAWGELRARLIAAATEWRTGSSGSVPARPPAAISLVLPVGDDPAEALRRRRLLTALEPDAELVYAGCARRSAYSCLAAAALGRPVTVVNTRATAFGEVADAGAGAATGDVLVLVAPGSDIEAPAVRALAGRLVEPAGAGRIAVVQPLGETPVMTVHSAGAAFTRDDPVPTRLLADHATADADRMGDRELPALWSTVLAIRRADFVTLGGLDPALDAYAEVDLSLRARAAGLGVPALVTTARTTVTHDGRGRLADGAALLRARHPVPPDGTVACLAAAGFTVTADGLSPSRDASGPTPCLRWAIDIAATPGPWGERWGDRHFANSLATALRRLGQQVAVDHRGANRRPSRRYDDVVLTLRGLYPVPAQRDAVNLLWVISHPDEVTAEELAGYDRVFAASPSWAAARQAEWGVPVEPLLQCTDTSLFNPGRAAPGSGPAVLFVGNTRHVSRPVVDHALHAGIDVTIYGTGWDDTAAAAQVVAPSVPNAELGALYTGAGVVLNDHWEDMRSQGFISNRLFDAVACATRVLSDPVDGADAIFGDCVRTFSDAGDVARLLADPDANWPDLDRRRELARSVAADHSFDRRAGQLLAAAIELRKA